MALQSTDCDCIAQAGGVIVWTAPVRLRPLASGLGTVVPHLLGDVPILPVVGWLQGARPLSHCH